jgi:hypothetical protein
MRICSFEIVRDDELLTCIYNVLEELRSGESLTVKGKQIHDQGLVTVLRKTHDELDQVVLEAYGASGCRVRRHHTLVVRADAGSLKCAKLLIKGFSSSSTTECRGSTDEQRPTDINPQEGRSCW